ncbi:uncharacterized protein [Henckelia pumila]|uniref:uncharacterized protein n=1 Tax=Henckelia pumila TaxID=405737 RepID=UPI003C6E82E8
MANNLKLRICRAVASTMQSCRSKDPNSTLPQNPVPPPPLSAAHFPSFHEHHLASAGETFEWKKEGKWHVVDKICDKTTPRREIKMSGNSPPPPELDKKKRRVKKKKKKKKKKKNVPSRLRVSTSSGDSGWYSSECGGGGGAGGLERDHDEEETETLMNNNISTDDSPAHKQQHRNMMINKRRPVVSSRRRRGASKPPDEADGEIPARLSMLKKLIPCTVDGKVKESFAVVKKSADPYEDFKNSMMEMILEKQMFEKKDLEQMLQCFLSLNSRHYHGIILQAFSHILDSIFTTSTLHHP